jgi:peptidoglycan/LPS O-acetylase OafA/YrhL
MDFNMTGATIEYVSADLKNSSRKAFSSGTSVFIDLTRALAAQLVVVGHALSFTGFLSFTEKEGRFYMQNFAVVIFFFISGLLIGHTTLNKSAADRRYGFADFFTDRFSRIYTVYLPVLLIIFCIDLITVKAGGTYSYYSGFNLKTFFANVLMLQYFPDVMSGLTYTLNVEPFGSGRPLWTIAIEWWFYLFFGWIFFLRRTKINKVFGVVICTALFIVPAYNILKEERLCLAVAWASGLLYAVLHRKGHVSHSRYVMIAGAVIMLLICCGTLRLFNYDAYNVYVCFATAVLLYFLLHISSLIHVPKGSAVMGTVKRFAGYSFSLYVLHYTILSVLFEVFRLQQQMNSVVALIAGIVICNVIALIFAAFTETKYKQVRVALKNKYQNLILKYQP